MNTQTSLKDNSDFVLRVLDVLSADLSRNVISARGETDVRDIVAVTLQNYADKLGVPARHKAIGFIVDKTNRRN